MAQHFYYFTMATTMWALYYLWGLFSNYFQDWAFMLQLSLIVLAPTLILGALAWRRFKAAPRAALYTAAIMAFYFTAPLVVYDWLVLGVHQGLRWSFLTTHWYLSIFYVIPWGLLVPLAYFVSKASR